MPRWPGNERTGRTVDNCKANPDGRPCPACKSTNTKFWFFNNKKKTQPRYRCLACPHVWTQGEDPWPIQQAKPSSGPSSWGCSRWNVAATSTPIPSCCAPPSKPADSKEELDLGL